MAAFKTSSPREALASTMRPSLTVKRMSSMMLPLFTSGSAAQTVPLAPILRGAVKISSVGRLATKPTPAGVSELPAAQR